MPQPHRSDHLSREVTKQWNRRGQKANDSEPWPVSFCFFSPAFLFALEIDDAMTRHQLFERVPIAMARGKKVRCQWLDEMKEGANGPFVRSRLVAMEVAHRIRLGTFAGTAPLKCIKIIICRAASIKNTRGEH